jgi:Tol biopolymer transport system component
VFEPDNAGTSREDERDRYIQSVWYRDLATGKEFKLAQFYEADFSIIEEAVSQRGDLVAFTRGNNTFLFEWNVWIVDTDGTGMTQITGDDISNYPSFHPSGDMLAIVKLRGPIPWSPGHDRRRHVRRARLLRVRVQHGPAAPALDRPPIAS